MKQQALVFILLVVVEASLSQILEDLGNGEIDERAAPWWEQQEEAAKRRCQSSCTIHSKGVKSQITLCDDTQVCPVNRKSIDVYASSQCQAWSRSLELLNGEGKQVRHDPAKGNWAACAVFCKTQNGSWYSPRKELEHLNVDPYFPDGVWCHAEGNTNYYCQNHVCLPEATEESP